jgi:hypothetical protein
MKKQYFVGIRRLDGIKEAFEEYLEKVTPEDHPEYDYCLGPYDTYDNIPIKVTVVKV